MSGPRIGYLVKAFPVVSETFILNEVRAMERHEVPLTILALKATPPGPVHDSVSGISSPLRVASSSSPLSWPSLLLDHGRLLVSAHRDYRRVFVREVGRFLARFLRRPSAENRLLLRKRLRRFFWAGWVAQQVRRHDIKHLHAHYAGEPLRVAHLVKRLLGTSYSFTAHAKDLYTAPESRLRRRLVTARFATSCHRDGVETLRRLAPSEDRVRFVRHGIDLELFKPPRIRPAAGGTPRLLAVGRLTDKKGFEDLVAACAKLASTGLDFECDIVGDGKLRGPLEEQIRARQLDDRVRVHGFVTQEALPAWHARATLFVAPSKELADGNRDGLPNVVIEAMASGLPIVASAAAGIPEMIREHENGLLTTPGDPKSLATGIARLLGDPALAARLGREAARSVADLDFVATNADLAAEFAHILSARVETAVDEAANAAWSGRGMARKARNRLGIQPKNEPAVETAIRAAVRPGLGANAWRPDLQRLAGRRMWDEVVKGSRLGSLIPRLLGPESGSAGRILDLGSGRGGLAVALQARGFDATALDLRFRNCLVARLRGRRYELEVPAVNSIGETLPFTDGSFDAVACLEVLEHVGNPIALLAEIHRVLKIDGRCVVTVINRWSHFDPHYHLWGINFLPRRLANGYIAWRRRTKASYRDRQTLDEMHYYSFRDFVRRADGLGFSVEDPDRPPAGWKRPIHALSRSLSLGFNTVTLVLRPVPSQPLSPEAQPRGRQDRGADRHEQPLGAC